MKRLITLVAIAIFAATSLCSAQENLNDIRFEGWTTAEWLNNDYIRELRRYIDACSEGEVDDQTLLAHKEVLKSKFIVGHIECEGEGDKHRHRQCRRRYDSGVRVRRNRG